MTAPGRTGYLPHAPDPAAPLRLFCFHHAGGAASVFTPLARALRPRINVVPVQLPGREQRAREPRHLDMAALVDELDRRLDPALDAPHAYYGHSLGALVAYRLAQRRADRSASTPATLVVGAAQAPDLPSSARSLVDASDDEVTRWMMSLGGMSEILLDHPAWLARAVALTRDDLYLFASDRGDVGVPLDCPTHAFFGTADPIVSARAAAGWARCTTGGFESHALPGGHFFLRDSAVTFTARLARLLTLALPRSLAMGRP
ncbi:MULTISPECIES: thioesterase II family protein [Streptomyces]|uniref:thioesterase II family protein n=1 Tax=Streptomyces TaxID=1883 RepID=UPI00186AF7C5|nr:MULTISPECIES: alpha/beta fold hydrolase [Streptomyces]